MFAIAFDLVVEETAKHLHPSKAYAEIKDCLGRFDFQWIQGSVYVCQNEDMANLFQAIMALKGLTWFPASVRDIRAFRIEQWSNFTDMIKG
jgi:virulence-associated protein VapD